MDIEKAISIENLNRYKKNTNDKIKSYVDTKTSVIQDGTKTVGGVTAEDYNNFKGAYDDKHTHSNKSVLDEISEKTLNGGAELSGSTGYTVTDSVEYPLVWLKVFGKSTQDGTPTPENPVEIQSVVEPTVTVCGKNLINAMYQTTTKGGITCTNNSNGTYTLNGTATSEAVFTIVSRLDISGTYRIIGCPPNGSNGTYNISVNVDGAWSVNNYDIGNGSIINPSSYIIIAIAVRNGVTCNNLVFKPMLTTVLTATYNDFEQHKENTLSLPDTLNAIPVSSGGNVTIDGQEYIADYVDFERGVKVQRVEVVDLGTLTWNKSGTNTTDIYRMVSGNINNIKKPSNSSVVSNLLCTTYQSVSPNNTYDKVGGITIATSGSLYIYDANYNQSDSVEEFKSSVQGQMLYYEVEEPIETPIPESEMQLYRQLQTYNGVTNISNDKGAGIEVSYCTNKALSACVAPITTGLQKQIDELKAAVLSLGGNV